LAHAVTVDAEWARTAGDDLPELLANAIDS